MNRPRLLISQMRPRPRLCQIPARTSTNQMTSVNHHQYKLSFHRAMSPNTFWFVDWLRQKVFSKAFFFFFLLSIRVRHLTDEHRRKKKKREGKYQKNFVRLKATTSVSQMFSISFVPWLEFLKFYSWKKMSNVLLFTNFINFHEFIYINVITVNTAVEYIFILLLLV